MDKNTWLEILSDRICESLPSNYAKKWHLKFLKSVNISSDLNKIKIPFLIFIVESVIDKFDHEKFPNVKTSISNILKLFKENTNDKKSDYAADADAAYYAAAAAYYDSYAYADSDSADFSAAAGSAAGSAAYYAASAAAYAAASVSYAADADVYASVAASVAARASASASGDAYIAEKENYYKKLADKLLELIEEYK